MAGSCRNSSSENFTGLSTRPSTSNVHVARSTDGVPCASSTGHFLVRDCPGGIRLSRRVSGLMITSESLISSGLRGALSWYLGSLIKVSRKLISRDQRTEIRCQRSGFCGSVNSSLPDTLFVLQRFVFSLDAVVVFLLPV